MPISADVGTPWVSTRPAWALRADAKSVNAGKRRRRWDTRHHNTWMNDMEFPNGRSYFDRMRERGGRQPLGPRPPLRPVWNLDVSPEEKDTFRVFDARTASFKEVSWKMDEEGSVLGHHDPTKLVRTRTPRSVSDLKDQRYRETDWNRGHGTVFSRFNKILHPNYRSYFDRWKDQDGPDVREPTWKLGHEIRNPLGRSSSEPVETSLARIRERAWKA
mmetsp:Transcript_4228/g.6984  ORF Transcript_4228/g.6984 Transcript_4228/m.6984 type:complete len:217 (+) Transcript_4228:83-733(+)